MIIRAFQPQDLEAVKQLLGGALGGLDPVRAMVVVAESGGKVIGVLATSSVVFVHSMAVDQSPISRKVADSMLAYALGASRAMGEREGLFVVSNDNPKMFYWLSAKEGAQSQGQGEVFTMRIL